MYQTFTATMKRRLRRTLQRSVILLSIREVSSQNLKRFYLKIFLPAESRGESAEAIERIYGFSVPSLLPSVTLKFVEE